MKIQLNKVTWYSVALAIILYIGVFCIAFYLGKQYGIIDAAKTFKNADQRIISAATFDCSDGKSIQAIFFNGKVELGLSDGRNMLLPQAISASGARYANTDESFVFWNKDDTAFIQEGEETTYKDCAIKQ